MGVPPLLAPFPHHSWIGYWEHVPDDEPLVVIHRRQVAHCLMYLPTGRILIRSLHHGHETRHDVSAGAVMYSPADGARQSLVGAHNAGHDYFTLLIPPRAAGVLAASEDLVWSVDDLRCFVSRDDTVLQSCMRRLAVSPSPAREAEERKDEAARRLLLRLQELSNGGVPAWHLDASVFERAPLQQFVEYIDTHLRLAPTLPTMALLAALSPSHFAKKFRQSTGLSLQRFINRRRVLASIPQLQANTLSLAHVALSLGFSSQSHFTRLFSDLTGMTPAKFRKQFRRTLGWRAPAAAFTPLGKALSDCSWPSLDAAQQGSQSNEARCDSNTRPRDHECRRKP